MPLQISRSVSRMHLLLEWLAADSFGHSIEWSSRFYLATCSANLLIEGIPPHRRKSAAIWQEFGEVKNRGADRSRKLLKLAPQVGLEPTTLRLTV